MRTSSLELLLQRWATKRCQMTSKSRIRCGEIRARYRAWFLCTEWYLIASGKIFSERHIFPGGKCAFCETSVPVEGTVYCRPFLAWEKSSNVIMVELWRTPPHLFLDCVYAYRFQSFTWRNRTASSRPRRSCLAVVVATERRTCKRNSVVRAIPYSIFPFEFVIYSCRRTRKITARSCRLVCKHIKSFQEKVASENAFTHHISGTGRNLANLRLASAGLIKELHGVHSYYSSYTSWLWKPVACKSHHNYLTVFSFASVGQAFVKIKRKQGTIGGKNNWIMEDFRGEK